MGNINDDKEYSLYTSFLTVCNEDCCKYKYILCFFHYMEDIRKYLQKNWYSSKGKKTEYDEILNFTKNLPFKSNNIKNIKKYFSAFKKKNTNILVSIISMPGSSHYNVTFKNYSNLFGLNDEKWYFYDDTGDSIFDGLLYDDICINNIRINNGLALFIYKRIIFN